MIEWRPTRVPLEVGRCTMKGSDNCFNLPTTRRGRSLYVANMYEEDAGRLLRRYQKVWGGNVVAADVLYADYGRVKGVAAPPGGVLVPLLVLITDPRVPAEFLHEPHCRICAGDLIDAARARLELPFLVPEPSAIVVRGGARKLEGWTVEPQVKVKSYISLEVCSPGALAGYYYPANSDVEDEVRWPSAWPAPER